VKIQRLVFPEQGRCEVEEAELDERLGPGEALIRNRCTLVSAGTEVSMFTRTHRGFDVPDFAWAKYPFHPGYAAVGEIVAGPGDLKPGTRVCHLGRHATYGKTKVSALARLPDDLPDEHAVFFRLAQMALTAPRLAPARLGENVLVIGMGLLGNLCAQLYRLSGAGVVAGADLSAFRLERAGTCGVQKLFHVAQKALPEFLGEPGPRGAELIIEASGAPEAIRDALQAAPKRGLVVLLGAPRRPLEVDPYFDLFHKGAALIGAHEGNVPPAVREADGPLLLEWLRTARLQVAPLVTHRLPLAQALQAYEGLRDKRDEYLGVQFVINS
jgi:2-desacetyl-2-hydroxyethyl bacteriochlorophyllide A dehydrogenase